MKKLILLLIPLLFFACRKNEEPERPISNVGTVYNFNEKTYGGSSTVEQLYLKFKVSPYRYWRADFGDGKEPQLYDSPLYIEIMDYSKFIANGVDLIPDRREFEIKYLEGTTWAEFEIPLKRSTPNPDVAYSEEVDVWFMIKTYNYSTKKFIATTSQFIVELYISSELGGHTSINKYIIPEQSIEVQPYWRYWYTE